jgi:peptide deformylase
MAIREILRYPSEILLNPVQPIPDLNSSLGELTQDMLETMYAAPGIGLAANQIGFPMRVAVIDISPEGEKGKPRILVNPKILSSEGIQMEEEGCLSLPGFSEIVKRPATIVVSALDLDGKEVTIKGEGILARALSHEIDHLDGKLFIHRLSVLKRDFIKRKIRKMMKTGEWSGVNP